MHMRVNRLTKTSLDARLESATETNKPANQSQVDTDIVIAKKNREKI